MRKILLYATIASGVLAAYLMLKRGLPIGDVAGDVVQRPFGSLFDELKRG